MPPPSNDKESILVVTGIGSIQYLFDMLVFELFRRVDVPKHTAFKKEEFPEWLSVIFWTITVRNYYRIAGYGLLVKTLFFRCRAPP